ncbi:Universal stress protein [Methanosarcina barkeri str. Wiesmoor]|uniref:Universal stress protein n=2 Tax=Methanosarcina barkeri TaxID=2208 RepID=A0A0E3QI04_METBA|nr:universal stress protein [Methanosarcina barkeri]AKB49428.1 Universal stress protein [Methanosarcina barkeri str. Wiesmoor]
MIATDGSKAAENVVDFGIEIAGCSGAKVYAVYVIDISFFDSILMDESWVKNAYEQFERVGRDAICCIEEKAKTVGVEAAPILLKGNAAEKILDFAENQKVDMIVIGSTGKSGVERFMLGSVSEKVMRNSKIPVLVVHERFKPESFIRCGQEEKIVSANIASSDTK